MWLNRASGVERIKDFSSKYWSCLSDGSTKHAVWINQEIRDNKKCRYPLWGKNDEMENVLYQIQQKIKYFPKNLALVNAHLLATDHGALSSIVDNAIQKVSNEIQREKNQMEKPNAYQQND